MNWTSVSQSVSHHNQLPPPPISEHCTPHVSCSSPTYVSSPMHWKHYTYLHTYYMYAYTYTCTHIICLPHVLTMRVCCRTYVGPKGPRSMCLLPTGLHLTGFLDAEGLWRCNDHLSRSVNANCGVDTHTYVCTHVHDHSLQLCMYMCVYVHICVHTISPIPTHKVQYLHAYTRYSLSLSFQHTLYKCMYCMYVHMYVRTYVCTYNRKTSRCYMDMPTLLMSMHSIIRHHAYVRTYVCVYVTQDSWWQYTLNTWCDERMDAIMLLNVSASQVKWNILAIIFSLSDVLKLSLSPSTCSGETVPQQAAPSVGKAVTVLHQINTSMAADMQQRWPSHCYGMHIDGCRHAIRLYTGLSQYILSTGADEYALELNEHLYQLDIRL